MSLPLVSCIVPVFNGEATLAETLQSILQQTYSHLEILVVDDGSTDGTSSVLESFTGKIKRMSQPHAGPAAARNLAVRAAQGDLIAFLDADDLWHADKIRGQVEYLLDHPELQVSFTHVKNFWSPEAAEEKKRFENQNLVKLIHPFHLPSFMGKRNVFEIVGLFREDLIIGEDSDWFTRMKAAGIRYDVLPKEFVLRRLHAKNLTRDMAVVTREEIQQRTLEALRRRRMAEKDAITDVPAKAGKKEGAQADRFFEEAGSVFTLAEKSRPDSLKKYYSIAGHAVELRFAGARLADLMAPALSHLETAPDQNPGLSVGLCDFSRDDARMPTIPWTEKDLNERMEVPGYDNDEHIRASYYQKLEMLSLFHAGRNLGYFLVNDAAAVSQPERGAPLVKIFRWWMRRQGLQLVHGGAVGMMGSGILLAGQGGAGKSTTALACAAAGFSYASDDYCLLSTEAPCRAHSLYCTGKMHTAALERIPRLKALASSDEADPVSGKTLFYLNRLLPNAIAKELQLRAVFVPVISSQTESTLVKASPIVALKALAPSTLFQLPGSQNCDFYDLAKLAEQLPCYVLRLGTSTEGVVRVISDYLTSL